MNCPFLHRWRWELIQPVQRHANQHPPDDPYWRGECILCGAVSNRTASRMPPKGSPHPTKAGVPAATSAPAPPH